MNVNFTESAAKQVQSIIDKEQDSGMNDLNLRVFVKGGGCSGFQYGFTLDESKDDDWVFETCGVKLCIDPMSGVYFKDATIDFKNDPLNGSSFVIQNPNAKSTCGCGSSAAF